MEKSDVLIGVFRGLSLLCTENFGCESISSKSIKLLPKKTVSESLPYWETFSSFILHSTTSSYVTSFLTLLCFLFPTFSLYNRHKIRLLILWLGIVEHFLSIQLPHLLYHIPLHHIYSLLLYFSLFSEFRERKPWN